MAKKLEVYKCSVCGNIVEILHGGDGALACCGQDMALQTENTTDAAVEKHVPVKEKVDGGWKVTIGEVAHPMTDDHYIEWVELIADGISYKKFLSPTSTPEAFFPVTNDEVTVKAYCNLHGLWKA